MFDKANKAAFILVKQFNLNLITNKHQHTHYTIQYINAQNIKESGKKYNGKLFDLNFTNNKNIPYGPLEVPTLCYLLNLSLELFFIGEFAYSHWQKCYKMKISNQQWTFLRIQGTRSKMMERI
jgi:hypothetical protein